MGNYFDQFDAAKSGNYFDQFDPVVPQAPAGEQVYGRLPFQAATGAIKGLAAVPGSTPRALGAIGDTISNITGLPKPPPIINAPPTPEERLNSMLPTPQGDSESLAQDIGGAALGGLLSKGHWAENLVGGIGAGVGAHYGPQIAPTFGLTPQEGAIAGALTGGFAGAHVTGNTANAVTRGAMPKPEEVIQATSDAYDNLRMANKAIVVPRDQMALIKNSTLQLLRQAGPSEEAAKDVYSAINSLDGDRGGTVADLVNARKNLAGEFHSVHPNANKAGALLALTVIDKAIDTLAPDVRPTLKTLDANWSAARAAQAVTGKVEQAQASAETVNSGLNSGNKILQSIRSYIKSRTSPETGKVYMNPSDLAALQGVRPSIGEKLERFSGIGGMGGVTLAGIAGNLAAQSANQLGASATEKADPLIGGIALPILGLAARGLFNRNIARKAMNAEAQILSRAPYMEGVSIPRGLLSAPQVAARSLLFAAPAIRDELTPGAQ